MTGPPKIDGGPPEGTATNTPAPHRPVTNRTDTQHSAARCQVAAMRRRREASRRMPPMWCGCVDPLSPRHRDHNDEHDDDDGDGPATDDHELDSWVAAADHLIAAGLNPLVPLDTQRALWRRSRTDRHLIAQIRGNT
jgi:hypothetical protein